MGKHGAANPIGNLFPSNEHADDSGSLYNASQQEVEHTQRMNNWFSESFANLFLPALTPFAQEMADAEIEKLNMVILTMSNELERVHSKIALLSQVVQKSMTASQYQKCVQQVHDELEISVKTDRLLFGELSKDDIQRLEDEIRKNIPDDRTSIFTITVKKRNNEANKSDAIITRDSKPESKSWLHRMTGR